MPPILSIPVAPLSEIFCMPRCSPIRFAIHGYGRIGRCFLRAWHDDEHKKTHRGDGDHLLPVAINEPADLASMVYLSQYDSTHGRFAGDVHADGENLVFADHPIAVSHTARLDELRWGAAPDLVVECSGQYSTRTEFDALLQRGGRRLLVSNPARSADDVDATIIMGFNEHTLSGRERIISAASCTTTAAVPLLASLTEAFAVEDVLITTLHSLMNDQPLLDGYHHHDLRRTRSAVASMIPIATGLTRGIERFLPQLSGKVYCKAIRVPTLNVSALDITLHCRQRLSQKDLHDHIRQLCAEQPLPRLAVTEVAHASIDFNHDPHSAIVDLSQSHAHGQMINLLLWFDNEWAFSCRMLELARHMAGNFS